MQPKQKQSKKQNKMYAAFTVSWGQACFRERTGSRHRGADSLWGDRVCTCSLQLSGRPEAYSSALRITQQLAPLCRERLPGRSKLLLEGEGAFQVGSGHGSEDTGRQTDRQTQTHRHTCFSHKEKTDYISNFPYYSEYRILVLSK